MEAVVDKVERIGGKSWFPPADMRLGAIHWLRRGQPWLRDFLGVPEIHSCFDRDIGGTFAWGGRIGAKITIAVATARRVTHWRLEDGFLRSVGLGKSGTLPLSIVADDLGLPVDARRESRLEQLIRNAADADMAIGAQVREAIVRHRLSKYNHLPHDEPRFERTLKRRILLVDQVVGDVSVPRAFGSKESFRDMLRDAAASGAQCIVRTHPDVLAGYRKGYLTDMVAGMPGITLHAEPVSAAAMLSAVDEVWTVASQFGFDALLRGLPVRCYAAPFYAGWALTEDRISGRARAAIAARRNVPRSIDHLAAAGYVHYPFYKNPENWKTMDVFETIDLIVAGQRATG